GAASIGALRAAELAADGMRGVGHVHRLFRCGALAEDDVYVLHAPAPLRYRCLTLPLVNVRYTLRAMRVDGRISRADEQALLAYLREVPWFDRDRHSVCAAAYAIFGGTRSGLAMQAFDL